ncbi:MAG: VWA domain-containing protein [Planctomycetota bacterium]|nr:VWA domain-containing protein [Planctomycetota bacterium]
MTPFSPRRMRASAGLAALVVCALLGLGRAPVAAAPEADAPAVPVDEALDTLKPWLAHEDWTVRSIAGFELRKRTEPGVIFLATRLLAAEQHAYAAAGALSALRGRPRRELVAEGGPVLAAALLRWAAHPHPTVSGHAREVLRGLPPVKLGDDVALYRGWWERGEDALAREQRALLEEARLEAERVATTGTKAKKGTSTEADRGEDRFYGRLELMRKHGLELCIVLDHTGSMGPVIGAAKAGAQRLIQQLSAYVPQFRAGLVTYDDGARLRATLTSDGAVLRKAFDKVGAGGGADIEEGVDKGIRLALEQGRLGWSQRAYRVIVVVGDAPPHDGDVNSLFRVLQLAREDVLYDKPVVVHTVSTDDLPVLHFPQIARAGGGQHVTLRDTGRLVAELVLLTFGGDDRDRVREWMEEVDNLRDLEPKQPR